ncbi:glycosyltransferase family 2 protein [Planctomycetales bacterium ZRK34]|nr:glycosyltransferase family 2 protein [Planctomycetales bacterium ZRK34]
MKSDLSVIIPAYNETDRLGDSLDTIRQYAALTTGRVEVIVVDDGSTDGTPDLVRDYPAGDLHLKLLVNEQNQGKGYSVRRGMLEASGDQLLMYDADGATPIEEVDKLRSEMTGGADVVIGSRAMPESVIDPPPTFKRQLMRQAFAMIRGRLMLPDICDTQCGFKLFTRHAAREIFGLAEDDGFAFDCEVLALARHLGYRIVEVGVVWRHHANSTIRPVRDSLRMLRALWRIRKRLKAMAPHHTTP